MTPVRERLLTENQILWIKTIERLARCKSYEEFNIIEHIAELNQERNKLWDGFTP